MSRDNVTMMHDGRVIVEGTPDEIRANETVHDLYLGAATAMSEPAAPSAPVGASTLLEVEGLSAFYGKARALDDVSFRMEHESVAIVGRNGMGKTTLCNAIMGISPPTATGSIRFAGERARRRPFAPDRPAAGSATFRRDGASSRRSRSTSTSGSPRAARAGATAGASGPASGSTTSSPASPSESETAARSSPGGEQQMLAIGRALVTNPRLLVMDEPSEGLAPAIIENMIETFQQLEREGLAILLIEQNLGVATALAERQLVMVAGSIAAETTADGALRRSRAAAALPRRGAARPLGLSALASLRPIVSVRSILAGGAVGVPAARRAAAAAPAPTGDDIAFVSSRDGDYAIYGMNANGADQGRLTDERGDPSTPAGRPVPDRSGVVAGRDADRVRERARRIVRHLRHERRRHGHAAR